MSTRSVVLVNTRIHMADGSFKEHPTARVYRFSDGYPDGNGLDVVKALASADLGSGTITNRNWGAVFLREYLRIADSVELEPPAGDGAFAWSDLSYLYVVSGDYELYGGKREDDAMSKVTIDVYDVPFDANPDPMYAARESFPLLYSGGWRGYPSWLREYSKVNNTGGRCVLDDGYRAGNWACRGASETVWRMLQVLSNEPSGAVADGRA